MSGENRPTGEQPKTRTVAIEETAESFCVASANFDVYIDRNESPTVYKELKGHFEALLKIIQNRRKNDDKETGGLS